MNNAIDLSKYKFLIASKPSQEASMIEATLKQLRAVRIEIVDSGKDALIKIKKSYTDTNPYKLIFIDSGLEEMQDFALLQSIRADARTKPAPIIIINASSAPEILKKMATYQPMGCFVAPLEESILFERLLSLIERTSTQVKAP